MMNKKGHIATMLMLIGALILIVSGLFAMTSFNDSISEKREEINKLSAGYEFSEDYIVRVFENSISEARKRADLENFGESFRILFMNETGNRDLFLLERGNYFTKINEGDFLFEKQGSDCVLIVEEVTTFSKSGESVMGSTFDLKMQFDVSGEDNELEIIRSKLQGEGKLDDVEKSIVPPFYRLAPTKLGSKSVGEIRIGDNSKTGIYFGEGKVLAKSYSSENVEVGNYNDGKVKVDNYAALNVPTGRRVVLEDLNKKNFDSISGGGAEINIEDSQVVIKIPQSSIVSDEDFDATIEGEGAYSCGPNALNAAFRILGKDVSRAEIQKLRKNGGGFWRGILSPFSGGVSGSITWPSEMKKIVHHFGFKTKPIRFGNKLDKADREIAKGNVVIVRTDFGSWWTTQHWTVYLGDDTFYDSGGSARAHPIHSAFVILRA